MKKHLIIFITILFSLPSFAQFIECFQKEGDTRYALAFTKNILAVVLTGEDNSSDLIYYNSARYEILENKILAPSFELDLNKNIWGESTLYKINRKKREIVLGSLICTTSIEGRISNWIKDNF
ncbi:MAG: hypothetical protein AB8E15_01490 [Bdellovibrionales bacterium]